MSPAEELTPEVQVRLKCFTPGPGYIESLLEPKISYIDGGIHRFSATELETADGKQRDVDIVVTPIGFKDEFTQSLPPINNVGDLAQDWRSDRRIRYTQRLTRAS